MVLDHLLSRRSIRSYKNTPVPGELVQALLTAALASASSRALRPWELIVVDDPLLIEALSHAKKHGSSFLAGAPLAFTVLGIPEESDVWIEDTAIVSSNILLEAEELGLGACWIQIRIRQTAQGRSSEEHVRQVLSIPATRSVESIIALGYPDEVKQNYTSEDLRWDKIRNNRY